MARIWIEPYQGQRHSGPPMDYWGVTEDHWRAPTLIPKNVLMVKVVSFSSSSLVSRIRDYIAYYERKTHPSSRLPIGGADYWEVQRWFERLPMYLLEEPKRAKVVKALSRALALAESGAFSQPL